MIKSVCLTGKFYIVFDIRFLFNQLIGLHLEALYKSGKDCSDDNGGCYPEAESVEWPARVVPQDGNDNDHHVDNHCCHQNPLCREIGVHIGITCPEDHSVAGKDQFPDAEPVSPDKHAQNGYHQSAGVCHYPPGKVKLQPLRGITEEIDYSGGNEDNYQCSEQPAAKELKKGQ